MTPWITMAQNNAWANATLYKALGALSAEAFAAARPGFFPSLLATMNHIYEVDLYYVDALDEGGQGRLVYDRAPIAQVEKLRQAQASGDQRFVTFCAGLTPKCLGRRVPTVREGKPDTQEEIGALILHLVQHQVHHRGQAHVQLHAAGIAPPQLDDFHLEYGRVPTAQAYFNKGD